VTFGVTPANPVFRLFVKPQQSSGESATVVSNEIRGDVRYQTSFWLQLMLERYRRRNVVQELDDDLEEALQGTWTANPNITVATLAPRYGYFATTATVGAALGSAFKTGMLVLTGGFTTAATIISLLVLLILSNHDCIPAATFAVEATAIPVARLCVWLDFQVWQAILLR